MFESLVLQAMQEAADAVEEEEEDEDDSGFSNLLPRVKRSSVGSISSLASNLSMHPAIRRLPMNDFADDSAVKFYLNRRTVYDRDREKKDGAGVGGGYVSVLGGGAATVEQEGGDRGGGLQYGLYDDEVEDRTVVPEGSQDEFSFSLGEGDVSLPSTNSSLGMEIPSTIGQGLRYLSSHHQTFHQKDSRCLVSSSRCSWLSTPATCRTIWSSIRTPRRSFLGIQCLLPLAEMVVPAAALDLPRHRLGERCLCSRRMSRWRR